MTFSELCNLIEFPQDVVKRLSDIDDGLSDAERNSYVMRLTDVSEYDEAWRQLKQRLRDDSCGLKMLCVMLNAACVSYKNYRQLNIPDNVFVATMKCFSRFASEYMRQYGCFGFDREFWVGRQLSLTLFRLGELEYELTNHNNVKEVALHIPSAADISADKVDESLNLARKFCQEYFPAYANVPYVITSWVLCPAISQILPPCSNLVKFRERFDIVAFAADEGYKLWVFGSENLKTQDFPQNTTLQRGLTAYIRDGGKMGEWTGVLRQ